VAPRVGLNLQLDDAFREAAYPLLEAGLVDALEWSFDMGWGPAGVPDWARALLDHYANEGRLLGHGVSYSAGSARFEPRQERWLASLREELRRRPLVHVSEHFGFMTAGPFGDGPPLPVPRCPAALRSGRDRLRRLADVVGAPIGLENLAFAFSASEVREQGAFLEELLAPGDGFLVLDLHNLYCQSANSGIPALELLASYPLARVRELHLSGGSWSQPATDPRPFRRDTHDGPIPDPVLELLAPALALCPGVHSVIVERLGHTLSPEQSEAFRADFRRVREIACKKVAGATSPDLESS
jgi:uncharacterized protein (UPF0276 family)